MSANFFNNSGVMVGIDLHHVQLPPTGVSELSQGHRQEDWPYMVCVPNFWPGGDDGKRTHKLTADGYKMIRDGFTIGKVPHQFAPTAVHPYEYVEEAKIIQGSKTTPFVKIKTVTSEGDPLSVCCVWAVGANLNCQESGVKLTGVVICISSVKTVAQVKDALFRIFDDFLKKLLIDWLTSLFDIYLKAEKVPWPIRPMLTWLFKKVITQLIEWLESLLKFLLDEEQQKHSELPKLDTPCDPPPQFDTPAPDPPADPDAPPDPEEQQRKADERWKRRQEEARQKAEEEAKEQRKRDKEKEHDRNWRPYDPRTW